MQLTEKVSMEWLDANNMTRDFEIGVPRNPVSLGLTWKGLWELTPEDFAAIDKYYESKQENESNKAN